MWEVRYYPDAEAERNELPTKERVAVENAVEKLKALGPNLPYPHQSSVRGGESLRELRPRRGKSPWRPLYERIGDVFVILSIGPEAKANQRGFDGAVRAAKDRLDTIEREEET